jgi:flagellar motor switch protein FliG
VNIVLTVYGHEKTVDKIAVSSFEDSSGRSDNSRTYCDMINSLKLEGNSWVYAKEIPENTPFDPKLFIPSMFSDLIMSLDNRALQRVLREVDNRLLAGALKGVADAVHDKVFQNMSERAVTMLKEELECMKSVGMAKIEECRDKIISIIRHLEDTGEIIVAH